MKYKGADWLTEKHHIEKLTCREMAELCGVSHMCITYWMKKNNIPIRPRIDSMKLMISQGKRKHAGLKGEDHPCWGKPLTDEHKEKIRAANSGEKNHRWSGGRKYLSLGYVLVHKPDHPHNMKGFVLEHRHVMEQEIGRQLLRSEDVHHVDEIKDNNKPGNLHIFKNRSNHSYYHKMKNLGREVELEYEYEQIHRNRKMV